MRDVIDNENLSCIEFCNQCVQMDKVYVKPGSYALSNRKLESLKK